MIDNDKRAFGGWWIFIVGLLFVTGIFAFELRYFGVVGERIIFENSYQKSASESAKGDALNAEMMGIDARLSGGGLTETQRQDLEAQKRAIAFQLNALEN